MQKDTELWVKRDDGLWHPSPKYCITGLSHDGKSLKITFQDGFTARLAYQTLDLPRKICACSIGASKIVILVELEYEYVPRGFSSKRLRDIAEKL